MPTSAKESYATPPSLFSSVVRRSTPHSISHVRSHVRPEHEPPNRHPVHGDCRTARVATGLETLRGAVVFQLPVRLLFGNEPDLCRHSAGQVSRAMEQGCPRG